MNWSPGTIVVCIKRPTLSPLAPVVPLMPEEGLHYTVASDGECGCGCGLPMITLAESAPEVFYFRGCFRIAEGGGCESLRLRAMQPVERT